MAVRQVAGKDVCPVSDVFSDDGEADARPLAVPNPVFVLDPKAEGERG
ncbi:MAG: hypothetical protein HYY08_03595 [Firmicutes bacterium]|nr:hypothetical protein [Bacillota bacterium]